MREPSDHGRTGVGEPPEGLCLRLASSAESSVAVLLLLCHERKVYSKCWFKGSEAREEIRRKNWKRIEDGSTLNEPQYPDWNNLHLSMENAGRVLALPWTGDLRGQ